MNDLDRDYIISLFDDDIQKKVVEILADDKITLEQKVEQIIHWMAEEGIE